jgi:hypothetical protein
MQGLKALLRKPQKWRCRGLLSSSKVQNYYC